jgi:transcriptional regulator with XRE-family HTH domain
MAFVCEAMAQTELGDQLRRAREDRGLSLEETEKATGIRKRFIRAMEEGRFDALPGQIQLRGFLRNYANYIGLNGDEMLALYERQTLTAQTTAALQSASPARPVAVQPAPPKPQPKSPSVTQAVRPAASNPASGAQPRPIVSPASRPMPAASSVVRPDWMSRLPPWLTLEVALIAVAVLLVICAAILLASILAPGLGQSLAPAPRPAVTRTRSASPPSPTAPADTPVNTSLPNITTSVKLTSSVGYVQVALAATEHVWVRVTTDGRTAFEGMFKPGDALNWRRNYST